MKNGEINFFKSPDESDKDLFFGPLDDEEFVTIGEGWIMAHVLHAAEIFPSVGQARKNGWDKPIPSGFTDFRTGKLKIRITILNNES